LHEQVEQAWGALGTPYIIDANGDSVRGFTVWRINLDRDANVRELAARAYYFPAQDRSNLYVLPISTANQIIWEDGDCEGRGNNFYKW
jgi:hypothetical protein